MEHLTSFLDLIYSMPLTSEGHDKLCWKLAENKVLRLVSYLSFSSTPDTLFPWKHVWHSKIPPRVSFFKWTAAFGKILTLDRLWDKEVPVMDWCYMCKRSRESVNHLLLHCPIAFELRSMVWALFGVLWVMPQSVTDLFSAWHGPFGRHQNIYLWRAAPRFMAYLVRKEH